MHLQLVGCGAGRVLSSHLIASRPMASYPGNHSYSEAAAKSRAPLWLLAIPVLCMTGYVYGIIGYGPWVITNYIQKGYIFATRVQGTHTHMRIVVRKQWTGLSLHRRLNKREPINSRHPESLLAIAWTYGL